MLRWGLRGAQRGECALAQTPLGTPQRNRVEHVRRHDALHRVRASQVSTRAAYPLPAVRVWSSAHSLRGVLNPASSLTCSPAIGVQRSAIGLTTHCGCPCSRRLRRGERFSLAWRRREAFCVRPWHLGAAFYLPWHLGAAFCVRPLHLGAAFYLPWHLGAAFCVRPLHLGAAFCLPWHLGAAFCVRPLHLGAAFCLPWHLGAAFYLPLHLGEAFCLPWHLGAAFCVRPLHLGEAFCLPWHRRETLSSERSGRRRNGEVGAASVPSLPRGLR